MTNTKQLQPDEQAIHRSMTLPLSAEHAFSLFTEGLASWWPAEYTWAQDVLETIAIEPVVNGRAGWYLPGKSAPGANLNPIRPKPARSKSALNPKRPRAPRSRLNTATSTAMAKGQPNIGLRSPRLKAGRTSWIVI